MEYHKPNKYDPRTWIHWFECRFLHVHVAEKHVEFDSGKLKHSEEHCKWCGVKLWERDE